MSEAPVLPRVADPFDWAPWLVPGEVLLWTGRPRPDADWRCILGLYHRRIPVLLLAIAGPTLLVIAEALWRGHPNGMTALVLFSSTVAIGAAVLTLVEWRRLRFTFYAVTQWRSLKLTGLNGPRSLSQLRHSGLVPRRLQSRCGETLELRSYFSFDPRVYIRPKILWFSFLDPQNSPFALLSRLVRAPDGESIVPTLAETPAAAQGRQP